MATVLETLESARIVNSLVNGGFFQFDCSCVPRKPASGRTGYAYVGKRHPRCLKLVPEEPRRRTSTP